jgi:hypothetical protein
MISPRVHWKFDSFVSVDKNIYFVQAKKKNHWKI